MRLIALFSLLLAGSALAQPYERIASAGGDLTEIVVALGDANKLVGIDTTSNFPPEITDLPNIGYVRALSAEGVLSLTPDLVIGAHDTGPQTVLEQLEAAGVNVSLVKAGDTAAEVPDKIRAVGEVLGRAHEAAALVEKYNIEMAEIAARIAGLEEKPRVLFILSLDSGAPTVGGTGTSADEIIRLAGGENAASGIDGFKPMNRETILDAAPDVILMMSHSAQSNGGVEKILANPALALTPAGQNQRAVTMGGMLLLGFGPRTPVAVRELAKSLHPGQAAKLGL